MFENMDAALAAVETVINPDYVFQHLFTTWIPAAIAFAVEQYPEVAKWFTMALIMALVGGEVKAAAMTYAQFKKTGFTGRKARYYLLQRYIWCSPLWHEFFALRLKCKPAYSVLESYMLAAVSYLTCSLMLGDKGFLALSSAAVISTSFFAARHGKAFLASRAEVEKTYAKGKPMLFSFN